MKWTPEQRELAEKYGSSGGDATDILSQIPVEERRYKCYTCHHIVDENPCPVCSEIHLAIMCPLDHRSCAHSIVERIEFCPLCGEPVCPECGSHDVSQVSRVTGYLADVKGWNAGKQQELKDRVRYIVE